MRLMVARGNCVRCAEVKPDHDVACGVILEEIGLLGALRRELAKCGAPDLHAGTAAVVWQVSEGGPMRISDLAAALNVDVSVASRQVGELVTAGYLERQLDPVDRRACRLSLTDAGRTALDGALARLRGRFREQLAGWQTDDLLRIAAELHQLRQDLLATGSQPHGAAEARADLRLAVDSTVHRGATNHTRTTR
jgi:DNA-binding MarR family transcriptional regulator